jgi:hypothetical protein
VKRAKVDDNQREIVRALRDAGASILHLHRVGGGCPDLAVGFRWATYLLEVKDGSKPPSAQKLTPAQSDWFRDWRGHAVVVNSPEAALAAIGVIEIVGPIS